MVGRSGEPSGSPHALRGLCGPLSLGHPNPQIQWSSSLKQSEMTMTNQTTRRTILGAIALVPLAGAISPASATVPDRTAWDAAFTAYLRAEAASGAHEVILSSATGCDALYEESDRLANLMCDAEGRLILTPAPDHPALMFKLERMFGEEQRDPGGTSPIWCAEWTDALMADARRLLAGEA